LVGSVCRHRKEPQSVDQVLDQRKVEGWIFGTPDQHLDPGAYLPVFLRVGAEIAGPLWLGLVLAVLGIILAPTRVERIRRVGWLATAAAAPLLFLNLYFVHNYYLIGVFPGNHRPPSG